MIVIPHQRHEKKETIKKIQGNYCSRTLGSECAEYACNDCMFDGNNLDEFTIWYKESTQNETSNT